MQNDLRKQINLVENYRDHYDEARKFIEQECQGDPLKAVSKALAYIKINKVNSERRSHQGFAGRFEGGREGKENFSQNGYHQRREDQ